MHELQNDEFVGKTKESKRNDIKSKEYRFRFLKNRQERRQAITNHKTGTREEWLAERRRLLALRSTKLHNEHSMSEVLVNPYSSIDRKSVV